MALDMAAQEIASFFVHTCTIEDRTDAPSGSMAKRNNYVARETSQICRKEVVTLRELEGLLMEGKEASKAQFRLYFPSTASIDSSSRIVALSGETVGDRYKIVWIPEVSASDDRASTNFGAMTGAVNHIEVLIEKAESA